MLFHILSFSVRQKLIALEKFAGKWAKMSIPPKFLSKILISYFAHRHPILQKLSRIILKYSDFIFYVATTKTNKFDFIRFLSYLSKSLKLRPNDTKFFCHTLYQCRKLFENTDFYIMVHKSQFMSMQKKFDIFYHFLIIYFSTFVENLKIQ